MKSLFIGVGRRGGDTASKLFTSTPAGVGLLYADTDTDDLELRPAEQRLRLGSAISDEDFVRNDPGFSYEATMMDREAVEARLSETDVLVLVSGLGGGTGAGGAKGLATIARDLGKPVIALITLPFSLEGQSRAHRGRRGLKELKKLADLVVTFHQDQLLPLVQKGTRVREAISTADEFVRNAARALLGQISAATSADELREDLGPFDEALYTYGVSDEPRGAAQAARFAFHGPFIAGVPLSKTPAARLTIRSRAELPASAVEEATAALREKTSDGLELEVALEVEPELEDGLQLHLFLLGKFGEPQSKHGDFFVPGPYG